MKNKRPFFLIPIVLLILGLSSCSDFLSFKNGTDISFDLPEDVCRNVAARAGVSYSSALITAKVELYVNDKLFDVDYQSFADRSQPKLTFVFNNVPVKAAAYANISLYLEDIEFGSGTSDPVTVKGGENIIEITLKMIQYSVPCTKYMIPRYNDKVFLQGNDHVDYFLRDSPTARISSNEKPDFENASDYCFDKEGNVYVITWHDPTQGYFKEAWLESNKQGFQTIILNNSEGDIENIKVFADLTSGDVYLYCDDSAAGQSIKKVGTDYSWSGSSIWSILGVNISNYSDATIKRIAVDNDIMWILYQSREMGSGGNAADYRLTKVIISTDTQLELTLPPYSTIPFNGKEMIKNNDETDYNYNKDYFLTFTDLIAREGFVYLPYQYEYVGDYSRTEKKQEYRVDSFTSRNDLYSYGGILRFDVRTDSVQIDSIDTSITPLDMKQQGRVHVVEANTTDFLYQSKTPNDYLIYSYQDLVDKQTALSGNGANIPFGGFINLYSPDSINTKEQFFGAGKTLAIRPKRLVISDSGYFFYTSSDIWRYKKVNRAVTIDLETFTVLDVKLMDVEEENPDCLAFATIGSGYFGATSQATATGSHAFTYVEDDEQFNEVFGGQFAILEQNYKGNNVTPVVFPNSNIPTTQFMLARPQQDSGYDYFISDYADAYIPSYENPDFAKVTDYCFDSDGYVYAITYNDEGEKWLKSNKNDFTEICLKQSTDAKDIEQIISDISTGYIYYTYIENNTYFVISTIDEVAQYWGTEKEILQYSDDLEILFVQAYDNCFYFFYTIQDDEYNYHYYYTRRKFSISGNDIIISTAENYPSVELDIKGCIINNNESGYDFNSDDNMYFSDMLYQEGYIYLFFNYNNLYDRADYYSYGGIIRIKEDGKQISQLGFSTDVIDLKQSGRLSVYNDGNAPLYQSKNQNDYLAYSYQNLMDKYIAIQNGAAGDLNAIPLQAYNYKIYCPNDSLSETRLFGPAKIAALKPKRLVFLDEGYCFYIDTDDIVRYKWVSRIVTVDLENFSIKSIKQPTIELPYADSMSEIKVFEGISSNFFSETMHATDVGSSVYNYNADNNTYSSAAGSSGNQLVIPYVKQDN